MSSYTITFLPLNKKIKVESGTSLLEAAGHAGIIINSVCGGDGICGRCKMIVKSGKVNSMTSPLLTRAEIQRGFVLSCASYVASEVVVEIPAETLAAEKIIVDQDAQRFRALRSGITQRHFTRSPLVFKTFLKLDKPTLENNLADSQRVQRMIRKSTGISALQAGLKILRQLPLVLRKSDFAVTALIGQRRDIAELIDIEEGDTAARNYAAVVDVGTTTVVVHLIDLSAMTTIDAQACFNSQVVFGREVTSRIMASEKKGAAALQEKIVVDINRLITVLVLRNKIALKDITFLACAGNTIMMHFLLGLPALNIRRNPFIAVSVEPPPFRAAEVGIKINPRGLLFFIPGISSWVGGDITAGILATGLYERDDTAMLIDVGTNGEIVLGNREWLVACSASTGPALEGGSAQCGMIAEKGAIEKIYLEEGRLSYRTIGNVPPRGICGSGIIDLIAVLLMKGVIDRAGKFIPDSDPALKKVNGTWRFVITEKGKDRQVYITQTDIDNVITAKAAVFAATKIMLDRLNLKITDVKKLFLAGGFGNYIDRRNAIRIGLLPDMPLSRIQYVGNTSIWGAKLAAFSREAFNLTREIRQKTTYYDLLGSPDYVEQFKQAIFLPHTNIELFPSFSEAPAGEA